MRATTEKVFSTKASHGATHAVEEWWRSKAVAEQDLVVEALYYKLGGVAYNLKEEE